MAFETGTCDNYKDLLDKLRIFVTTNPELVAAEQDWEVLRWNTPSSGEWELILKGPGLSGDDEIFVGLRTKTNVGSSQYMVYCEGYTGFNSGDGFYVQPGYITEANCPRMLLINNSMLYWFFVTGRRIIIVVLAGTVYHSAYLGLTIPYAPTGLSITYPMYIGASTCIDGGYGDANACIWSFWDNIVTGKQIGRAHV